MHKTKATQSVIKKFLNYYIIVPISLIPFSESDRRQSDLYFDVDYVR